MAAVKAWFRIEFYAELPDDEGEADAAYDVISSEVERRLNDDGPLPFVAAGSVSVVDGDTEYEDG